MLANLFNKIRSDITERLRLAQQNRACKRLGCHLEKATLDHFEYALQLKNGVVFYFEEASVRGEWVYLHDIKFHSVGVEDQLDFNFERGVQIRLSEIAWIADAPYWIIAPLMEELR